MLASGTVGLPWAIPFSISEARSRMLRSQSKLSGDLIEPSGNLSTISRNRIEIERSVLGSPPKAIVAADLTAQEDVGRAEARDRETSVGEIAGDGFAAAAALRGSGPTLRVMLGRTVLLSRSLSGLTTVVVDLGGGGTAGTARPQSERALSRSLR